MTTMKTDAGHQQFVEHLQRLAAAGGFVLLKGAPLTKFTNTRTGGWIITRDVEAYRRIPEWVELPFDRSARG